MKVGFSTITFYRRSDGSVTSIWKGLSPFVIVSGDILRSTTPKKDGTHELGQWRLRRLCQVTASTLTARDEVWMMKDGLTARFLAWIYDWPVRLFYPVGKFESRWNKSIRPGELLPKTSIAYWLARFHMWTLPHY